MSDCSKHSNCCGCDNFKGLVSGLLLGFGAGVVFGLLKAPKEGKELQKDLKKQIEKTSKKIKEVSEDVKPKISSLFGNVTNEFNELYDDLKKDITKASLAVKEKLNKTKFEEIVDKVVGDHKKKKDKYAVKIEKIGQEFKDSWEEIKDAFKNK